MFSLQLLLVAYFPQELFSVLNVFFCFYTLRRVSVNHPKHSPVLFCLSHDDLERVGGGCVDIADFWNVAYSGE